MGMETLRYVSGSSRLRKEALPLQEAGECELFGLFSSRQRNGLVGDQPGRRFLHFVALLLGGRLYGDKDVGGKARR